MSAFRDLIGQRFGRLIAVCPTKKRKNRYVVWLCRCDCGNLTEVRSGHLRSELTQSCGCLQKEIMINNTRSLKHRDAILGKVARLYRIWLHIKTRCLNPSALDYKYYGGRGISVCERWKNNYMVFKIWAMANGYAENLVIDRIDNDGDYTPDNCQWITGSENSKKPKYKKEKKNGKYR